MLCICGCFCGQQMAGNEEVGKTVGFRRFAKKRQAFQQAKTVGCCSGIARPSLVEHQLADLDLSQANVGLRDLR